MRALNHLYDGLRGAAAVIEGVEFLLTHRPVVRKAAGAFAAAAVLVAVSTALFPPLQASIAPVVPGVVLPWYAVLLEWMWSQMPAVLAMLLLCWGIETVYLQLGWTGRLVDAVTALRGGRPRTPRGGGRWLVTWLMGGVGCAGLIAGGVPGIIVAVLAAVPILGAGLIYPVSRRRGWPAGVIGPFLRSRPMLCGGVGLGAVCGLAVPIFNLVVFPCAVVGVSCLLLREERAWEN